MSYDFRPQYAHTPRPSPPPPPPPPAPPARSLILSEHRAKAWLVYVRDASGTPVMLDHLRFRDRASAADFFPRVRHLERLGDLILVPADGFADVPKVERVRY